VAQAKKPIVSWILQALIILILLMAGPIPKLTGDEGAIALFTELGAEPIGRYVVGALEAIAMILLIVPKTTATGAVLTAGLMFGAIMGHIIKLGISISADVHPGLEGPSMFIMASVAFIASLIIIILRRAQLPIIGAKFTSVSAVPE